MSETKVRITFGDASFAGEGDTSTLNSTFKELMEKLKKTNLQDLHIRKAKLIVKRAALDAAIKEIEEAMKIAKEDSKP